MNIKKKGKIFYFYQKTNLFRIAELNEKIKVPRKSIYSYYAHLKRIYQFRNKLYTFKYWRVFKTDFWKKIYFKKDLLFFNLSIKLLYKYRILMNLLRWIKNILFLSIIIFYIYKEWTEDIIENYIKDTLINVCQNPFIHEQIAKLLLRDFVRSKSTKKRMSPLFCKILHIEDLKKKLDVLVKKVIIEYLKSKDCENVYS